MSTVTVVIPTYNRAHLLPRAIESVRAQTLTDWRLLIVDDGSTDATRDVVACFDDPRIRYLRLPEHQGQGTARNAGLVNARGSEYIAWLDSDDEYLPTFLEQTVRFIKQLPSVGLVRCGAYLVDGDRVTKQTPSPLYGCGWVVDKLLTRRVTFTAGGACLLRTSAFTSDIPLFDEELAHGMHRDWLVLLAQECMFAWFPEPLVRVHVDGADRLSADPAKVIQGWERFICKHGDALRRHPGALAHYHHRLARLHQRQGNRVAALRHRMLGYRFSLTATVRTR